MTVISVFNNWVYSVNSVVIENPSYKCVLFGELLQQSLSLSTYLLRTELFAEHHPIYPYLEEEKICKYTTKETSH